MRWYLDCYTEVDYINQLHPVNTYWSESLETITAHARMILKNPNSGIGCISISKTTFGQSPMELP